MERIDQKGNARESKSYEHFSFLLPATKQWFSPKEMAGIIGKTDQYVRDAFDNQKILGHLFNGRAPKGKEKRKTYMIPRENILLFLFETANFLPDDFIERLCEILGNRTISQLLRIQKKIDAIVSARNAGFFNGRMFGDS
jgi:hypothetical protein